jgi:hypothetical protein
MNAETKAAPTAETVTVSEFERLLTRAVERVERAAAPQVQPMELRTFAELERWAERVAQSGMAPKDYRGKPDDIIVAVQMGAELGLRPMQALINIMTTNGRPTVWGDAMLALCKMHPAYVSTEERVVGDGEGRAATCVTVRRGEPPIARSFSVADAKKAGLWSKSGPWSQYPDRMLQMRARSFALRDAFPDKLRGLISAEEAADYQSDVKSYMPPESAAPPAPPAADEPAKPRYTAPMFLADIKKEFDGCTTQAAIEAVCTQRQRSIDALKNGFAAQFKEMRDLALDRVSLRAEPPPHVTALRDAERDLEEMIGERPAMET